MNIILNKGTTGVACKQLGRNFIGYEISPEYFKIAEKRIGEAIRQKPLAFLPILKDRVSSEAL